MEEAKSMLMRMCTENVYSENIFHVLGLRTSATARQIRRRREDFESAKALGGESWKEAFHLIGSRAVPCEDEVEEAFSKLEDPECRIVSEFFWVWLMGEDDCAVDEIVAGRKDSAVAIWEQEANGYGERRLVARHNLAVMYQMLAVDAEEVVLAGGVCDGRMQENWQKAFECWEELADSDDFWEIYEKRMRELDDPRLTGGFIRRFRKEFPIAFDNINAQLAARYAKAGKIVEAKRHIDYMKRTMSGLDDIQENMNIIFSPMEQRVKLLIDGYDAKVKTDAALGLECANKLLVDTEEIRRVALGMSEGGQRIRAGLFALIVKTCNFYQVQYGNKTEDWNGCKKLLERLKVIACTPESKKIVEGNLKTVEGNIKYDETESHCWFCKTAKATTRFDLKMYGDVVKTGNETHWRILTIPIPACAGCCRRFKITRTVLNLLMPFTFLGAIAAGAATESWLVGIGVFVGMLVAYSCLSADNKCDEYPAVKEALGKGFKMGDHP